LELPGMRQRQPKRSYIRESGDILNVVGMGVKRIGTQADAIADASVVFRS
jgi:hypothetical protein